MAELQYPNMKGKAFDHSSAEWVFKGVDGTEHPIVKGIKNIDWGITRTGGKQYGTSATPIRRKRGQYDYSASVTWYKEDWDAVRDSMGDGYMEEEFNVFGTWLEGRKESTVEILSCTILEESESTGEDGEPEVTVSLEPMRILVNGISPSPTA